MAHHVVLEKRCNCALKKGIGQLRTFDTLDEAESFAYEWAEELNNSLCGTHGFDVVAVEGHYVVSVETGGFVESCDIG